MGQPNYKNGFEVTLQEHMLEMPLKWKRPRMIFVNSMSDLFHDDVSLEFIKKVFSVMNQAHWHTFQVLTKRADRLAKLSNQLSWASNICMGVTVENNETVKRIEYLKDSDAFIKFISFEPLLERIELSTLEGVDWAIVGGESGPYSRPLKKEWVIALRELCLKCEVPFFFKQWGTANKKKAGRLIEGKVWNQLPKLYIRNQLKQARQYIGITQQDLANYLKISKETVTKYETGATRTANNDTYTKYNDFITLIGIMKNGIKSRFKVIEALNRPLEPFGNVSAIDVLQNENDYMLDEIVGIMQRIFDR
jgi:protein gp37